MGGNGGESNERTYKGQTEGLPLNMACRDALETAIHESYHDYCLDTGKAAAQVAAQFGMERVAYVLANTVRAFDHDGRISRDNKAWAQAISPPMST